MSFHKSTTAEKTMVTLHLKVKRGDVYPRIITAGDERRARAIIDTYLKDVKVIMNRNFLIGSGLYKGVGVSVIAIGMGYPNMDFLLREVLLILAEHPVVTIIRSGTCGLWQNDVAAGAIAVADRASFCIRNMFYFDGFAAACPPPSKEKFEQKELEEMRKALCYSPYLISAAVKPDAELTAKIIDNLKKLEDVKFKAGLNISADTFYAPQCRDIDGWEDENENLTGVFADLDILSCEMETHALFHLAHHHKSEKQVLRVAALSVGVVDRISDKCLTHEEILDIATRVSVTALDALVE